MSVAGGVIPVNVIQLGQDVLKSAWVTNDQPVGRTTLNSSALAPVAIVAETVIGVAFLPVVPIGAEEDATTFVSGSAFAAETAISGTNAIAADANIVAIFRVDLMYVFLQGTCQGGIWEGFSSKGSPHVLVVHRRAKPRLPITFHFECIRYLEKHSKYDTIKDMARTKLFALLTAVILIPSGLLLQTPPSHAAPSAMINSLNIVKPGQVSTDTLQVDFSGLGLEADIRLYFTGVTLVKTAIGENFSTTNSSYTTCPGTDFSLQSGISLSNSTCFAIADSTYERVGWASGHGMIDVGGFMSLKIASGGLKFASSGPWVVKAYNNADPLSAPIATFNLTNLQPQAALSVTSTSGNFGQALPLTTAGGSGTGAVTYSVANGTASGCAVSGTSLTTTSAGTCIVTARKAADSTYDSVSSSPTTITIAKAPRLLSFGSTTTYTLAYGATQQLTATPSAGVGDGTITYSSTGSGCTVGSSDGVVRVTSSAETCTVSASITAGVNYVSASTQTQVTINSTKKAVTLTGTQLNVSFGTTFVPEADAPADALPLGQDVDNASTTFTFTGISGTTYGPSTAKPTDAGSYSMMPSNAIIKGVDSVDYTANYTLSYAAGSVTISKATRTITFSGQTSRSVQFGDTTTVLASAVGDGAVSYSVGSSSACQVNTTTGVVTVTSGSGTCVVNATISEGTNYLAASTTTPITVTVTPRAITVAAASESVTVGNTLSPSFTIASGSLIGSDDITSVTYSYAGTGSTTYASSTTAPTAVGTYSVTASQAVFSSGLGANYSITYTAGSFAIQAKLTRTLNFETLTYSLQYGDTQTVVAAPSSGASEGVVTYSSGASDACTVSSSTGVVTVTAPSGTCEVSASITEGASFAAATSATPVTITVNARAITITSSSQTILLGGTVTTEFSLTAGSLVGSDAISSVTQTYVGTSPMSYAPSTTPPTVSGVYSVTPSAAVFSTGAAANYHITYVAGSLSISAPATPSIDLSMSATVGMLVAGTPVEFSASGLADSAPYSVIVRSTPRVLSSGTALGGAVSNSATIPAGLEAGWHTLTFSSTAANGSSVKQVMYFEVSESGRLLEKTNVMPAELAVTGGSNLAGVGIASALVMLAGLLLSLLRRRRTN